MNADDWADADWQARADTGRGLGGQHLREGRPMPPFNHASLAREHAKREEASTHLCEAWVGTFDQGGATACGAPAVAKLSASWGSSWYVCERHDVRTL